MGNNATMLGSGSSSASPSVADFVRLVSFNLSRATHFRPDQFTCGRISAWKRSINCHIDINKRISFITAVLSDRRGAEVVKRLCRDDAQAFVDMIDEVLPHPSIQVKRFTDLNSKFPAMSSRRWIA